MINTYAAVVGAADGLIGHVPEVLKVNDVRLVAYVPDNVLTPLISGVHSDNYFLPICATREASSRLKATARS
jgi:hypothetical protein